MTEDRKKENTNRQTNQPTAYVDFANEKLLCILEERLHIGV